MRCFGERQRIDFSDEILKPKQWTIILGDNGTGKTTILQSLIGMTPSNKETELYTPLGSSFYDSKIISDELLNPRFIGGKQKLYLLLRFSLLPNIRFLGSIDLIKDIDVRIDYLASKGQITSRTGSMFDEKSANAFFCLGYGAARKAGETSISELYEDSAYRSLFDAGLSYKT